MSDYIPKVGEPCEISINVSFRPEWYTVTPRYIGLNYMIYDRHGVGEHALNIDSFSIRPIKSEREIEIEKMVAGVVCICTVGGGEYTAVQSACEQLYDAGYRKVKL